MPRTSYFDLAVMLYRWVEDRGRRHLEITEEKGLRSVPTQAALVTANPLTARTIGRRRACENISPKSGARCRSTGWGDREADRVRDANLLVRWRPTGRGSS